MADHWWGTGSEDLPYPPTRRVCALCGHDRADNIPVGLACNCKRFFGAQPPAETVPNWLPDVEVRDIAWRREYGKAIRGMLEPMMGNNEPMSDEQVDQMMIALRDRRRHSHTD